MKSCLKKYLDYESVVQEPSHKCLLNCFSLSGRNKPVECGLAWAGNAPKHRNKLDRQISQIPVDLSLFCFLYLSHCQNI